MQKRKKQLLGLVGLALVLIVTAFACAMPPSDASAVDGTTLRVEVKEPDPGPVDPEDPENPNPPSSRPRVSILSVNGIGAGSSDIMIANRKIYVSVSYRNASKAYVELTNTTLGDPAYPVKMEGECSGTGSGSTKTCVVEFDLPEGYLPNAENGDKFFVKASTTGSFSGATGDAATEFLYRSAFLVNEGKYDSTTHNPLLNVVMSDEVKYATVQVFNSAGEPVGSPIAFNYDYANPETGIYQIMLALKEAGAPNGKYTAVLMAYSSATPSEDTLISVSTIRDIPYTFDGSPLPPDTGENGLANLNISQADYIVTGLIAFGVVTVFAIFLVIRRSRR